ncbi:protein of unknown function [Thermococcus nautili]|nr:protein of unknown function [Thermococcus nautili]
MKRGWGVLIIGIMLGALVYGAMVSTPMVLASEVNEDKAYDDFWRILNDEAYLVVAFNDSLSSGNPNATLAQKLIDNSRQGELNSANISAQIWLALEELKKSGVKLYYSADELRQMAEQIKSNGLPAETVNELKAQGWTDDEIRALEEYIAKNADNITSGFDMGSFLTNFSQAFVMVGFKYADYETWALEKWKWPNAAKSREDAMRIYGSAKRQIVPDLSDQWSEFYHAYLSGDVGGMSSALDSLAKGMDSILIHSKWTAVRDGGLIYLSGDVKSGSYYWPTAVEAYRQLRRVYVLVNAMKLGNNNLDVKAMLNREVAELKDALVVYSKTISEWKFRPPENPPIIIDPCEKNPLKCRTITSGSSGNSDYPLVGSISNLQTSRLTSDYDIALDVNSNYGYISIKNVSVVVDDVTSTKATYHIEVSFRAEHNAVSDVNVTLTDSSGSDSGHYSMVHPDDGTRLWKSKKFTVNFNGKTQVTVSGTVKISYLSTPTPIPMSNPSQPTVSSSSSSSDVQVAVESYSKTITANLRIDPAKVSFEIVPSKTEITEGSSVSFTIKIRNENDVPISGQWSFHAVYKDSGYNTHSFDRSNSVTVQPHDTMLISVGPVPYPVPGTYGYSGSFKFGPNLVYSKDNSSEIVVVASSGTPLPSPTPSTGRLRIVSVSPEPAYPKEGDTVSFNVKINSTYPSTQKALVKLFVDDEFIGSKQLNVSTSGALVTLQWFATHAGEHTWRVELWRIGSGTLTVIGSSKDTNLLLSSTVKEKVALNTGVDQKDNSSDKEDEDDGNITVRYPWQQFAVKLEAFPTELEGGGTVFFTVKVWNFANQTITLSGNVSGDSWGTVKSIDGFEGRVPANAKNYTLTPFSLDIYGVGNHTFKLFLDNADGKPNGVGEEHWSEVKVEVKGSIVPPNLDCTQEVFPGDKITCVASWNPKTTLSSLTLKEVWFGTKKVWNVDLSSVNLVKGPTLTPSRTIKLELRLDDDFANYYFGEKPWDPVDRFFSSYKDRLGGYTYKVRFIFDGNITAETLVMVKDRGVIDEVKNFYNDLKDDIDAGKYATTAYVLLKGSGKLGTKIAKRFSGILSILFIGADFHDWFFGSNPDKGYDNNDIVGG